MMKHSKYMIGQKYRPLLERGLQDQGLSTLWLPDNPDVAPALCGHADLSAGMLRTGTESHIFLAQALQRTEVAASLRRSYQCQIYPLSSYHFQPDRTCPDSSFIHFISEKQSAAYPHDVPLNIRQIGNTVFLNPKTTSSAVLCFLDVHSELRQVHVNQGYTACSILPCGEHVLITADEGIAYAAIRAGFDVLKIRPGHIDLPGYSCGFIGGSAFPIEADHIAFTGILDFHPDRNRILDFLREHSITPVYLTDRPLFDIGGAVPMDPANLIPSICCN